ncbi:MAG: leucine-rich repeat protein [Eubacterium sp.]|nr:leucine-rich repeat protein [Eubacterium sp.]
MWYWYSEDDDGITVLRVWHDSPSLAIAERIEGKKVVSLAPYCFSEKCKYSGDEEFVKIAEVNSEISRSSTKVEFDKTLSSGKIKSAGGDYLQEIKLPTSLKSIGDLCFYQCRKLTSIEFGSEEIDIGSDAFMNCRNFKTIKIRGVLGKPSGLRGILAQRSQAMDVFFDDGAVHFPEYSEQYELIGPAHIFELNVEGEGFRARQCFAGEVFQVDRYDEVFSKGADVESIGTLCKIAFLRLSNPANLAASHKKNYREILLAHISQMSELMIKHQDMAVLDEMMRDGLLTEENLQGVIRVFSRSKWIQGIRNLLAIVPATTGVEPSKKKVSKNNVKKKRIEFTEENIHQTDDIRWEMGVCDKILRYVRDELFMDFRFMTIALSALEYKRGENLGTMATNGESMYYSSEQLMRVFEKNPKYLNRLYLHTVLHCLFSHLWIAGTRDRFKWMVACDIAVEYTIDHMDKPSVSRILGLLRQNFYAELKREDIPVSAPAIYSYIDRLPLPRLRELHLEFFADDHGMWPKPEEMDDKQFVLQQQWSNMGRQTQMEEKRKGSQDEEDEESLLAKQIRVARGRRNYRDFLRQFTVMREEMGIDMDEFDMGYYTYGLSIYGNMPLIEPMETREVKKIKDVIIAVDTSYSTSGELIRNFLKETFTLLSDESNYFRNFRIHIIQADEKVQSDSVITSVRDIDGIFDNFEIKGGGNTDFRPVFEYVAKLEEAGEFEDLCGLLYFTDGKGVYPSRKPSFKTAFLFMDEYDEDKVPAWAIREDLSYEY